MKYRTYVISTILYGIVGLLGIIGIFHFLSQKFFFLSIICLLIAYVAFDNFFCGTRLNRTGRVCKTHYTIPDFLKPLKKQ